MIMYIPVNTPSTNPTTKPPPMKRLTMAAGKTMNADRTLKPSMYRKIAPRIIMPSTTPSMKLKLPSWRTHGKKRIQVAKNDGHSSAAALTNISAAEMRSNTTESRL